MANVVWTDEALSDLEAIGIPNVVGERVGREKILPLNLSSGGL